MSGKVVISGPASWNRIVLLEHLPEPVPHMQFALGDHETVGGTSAGKALGLGMTAQAVGSAVGEGRQALRGVNAAEQMGGGFGRIVGGHGLPGSRLQGELRWATSSLLRSPRHR